MKKYLIPLLFVCTVLSAGNNPRSIKALRAPSPPVIDGYGSDEVWKQANTAAGFIQRDPNQGEPERHRTEVKVLYDDDNIYFFAMMYDSAPDSIVARLARRDQDVETDYFALGLDSYNDNQTSFIFIALPTGSKGDELDYNDGRDQDDSWDPVWDLKTRILSDGWSAEMKIPLSQIRFTPGNDTWGITFVRRISRLQEETHWALLKKEVDGTASQFGSLTGMADVKLPPLLEVLPYAVGSSEHYPQRPGREKIEKIRPNAGVDVKYGVSSSFTLDATINPDFAQVEADPAVLNLTTFETFYPEKRPFFIEGTQIIRFVTFGGDFGPGLFYSRRIGKAVDVRLPPDGAVILDEPRSATILGAVKFSGKTESGTSIGVLTALTDEEEFSYRDTLGNTRTFRTEPSASYNLVRVKQDFWNNSNVGAIVTGTARNGRNPAYTAGADWDLRLDGNNYRINGFYAHSRIVAASGEMREGAAGKLSIGRTSGEWTYNINTDFTSKRYFINDIGFFRSPNDYGLNGTVTYRSFTPGTLFRQYNININPHLRWNYDRLTLFREIRLNTYAQFLNYWAFETGWGYTAAAKDPYDPRGYGVYNYPSSLFFRAELATDSREPIIVNLEENVRRNAQGATVTNTQASVVVRPTSAMEYELSAGYATERRFNAFAAAVSDSMLTFAPGIPTAMYGQRDVDGTDLTLRSSILFAHNLSLQIYNQLFWVKGKYDDFSVLLPDGNLQNYPRSGLLEFDDVSLVSNVVVRWEYREGSTFYVVWSHGRSGNARAFDSVLNNIFAVKPDNVYVVKASYWMSL